LTLIAVTRTKKLHKIPANTFILSLAFADGMVGVLSPAIVLTAITNEQHIWMSAVCLFRGPYYAMFSTSLVTLLAIAIDRYMAVVHPLIYRMRMTVNIARYTCIGIWLVQITLWEILTCYYGSQFSVGNGHSGTAQDIFPGNIFAVLTHLEISLPIIGNVILYALIYTKLRKRMIFSVSTINNMGTLNVNQTTAKTKAFTKMMTLVVGYLILAWLPYYVVLPLHKLNDPQTPTWYVYMFDVVTVLLYTNSFMNPIIYCWQNREFRGAYIKPLQWK
jgi:tachykinin-like receptor